LNERGLLDSTLVIWMGEFGRTPLSGQNHFARAWTAVLAGAGIRAGQAIGRTGAKGNDVEDRPISPGDFMATVCHALGIDHTKNYTARNGRPMNKVDKGATPVKELFA
jgi:arylsulfatase A-like enzyme